jgi:hypothetical protein
VLDQLIKPEQVSTKYLLHTLFNLSVDLSDTETNLRYYLDEEGYLRQEATSLEFCTESDTLHIIVDPFNGRMPNIEERSTIDSVDIADFIHESLEIDGLEEKIEIAFQDISNYIEEDVELFYSNDEEEIDY